MGRALPLIVIPLLVATGIFVPRMLAFLPAVIALLAYLAHAVRSKELLLPGKSTFAFLVAITALSFGSVLWAAFPEISLERSYTIAGLMFSGFILLATAQKLPSVTDWPLKETALATAATVSLSGLFLYAEISLYYPLAHALSGESFVTSYWNRGLVVLAMALVPALFLLQKQFGWSRPFRAGALVVTVCVGLPMTIAQSQTAQIIFLISLAAYIAANLIKKYLIPLTGIAVLILTLTAPLIPSFLQETIGGMKNDFVISASMPHRLEVWNFVADSIKERPLLGYGVECIRSMKSKEIMPHMRSDSVLHPHNAFLQVWVETGVPGTLLFCALIIFLLQQMTRAAPENRPLYYAVFVSALSLLSTGYGLWQGWQMGLLLSLTALCIMASRILPPAKS